MSENDSVPLLQQLTEAHSVSGFEGEVRDIFKKELEGKGEIGTDRLGSVYCRNRVPEQPQILVAGHMDEVGFRVQAIHANGFLSFVPVGGWWGHNLLSQRVELKTHKGEKITGIIASKPPHFLSKAERGRVQEIEAMFIDVAASSAEEVRGWGIRIGDPIAPVSTFKPMRKSGRYLAKAFDNRVGMAAAIEVGRRLLPSSEQQLVVAGTVQEEVGLRGSRTLANLLEPDYAIVLEGPPADDTPGNDLAVSQGILGGGVQVRLHDPSAIMDPQLVDIALSVAEKKAIPHQVTVRRSGGTDAGGFHLSGIGIPSIVLGVPARYIHSHNSIIDLSDYQAMVELTTELVKALKG